MKWSTLKILSVAVPTAAALFFESGLMLSTQDHFDWRVVLGRTALMGVAALIFSTVMFHLIKERDRAVLSERLARLIAARTLQAQEEERRRIARELHDGIGQQLYSLRLSAQIGRPVEEQCAVLMEEVQRLATSLYPPVLEKLGLVAALQAYVRKPGQDGVAVEVAEGFPRLAKTTEAALFRIFQEAVGNALRHGGARKVRVRLECRGDRVCLEVRDDGTGFDPAARQGTGIGLASMRERAESLGGTFRLHSRPGEGSSVLVTLPVEFGV